MDIEKHGSGSVCDIRCVNLPARQLPDEPCVDRAEEELVLFRHLSRTWHMVKDPADLSAGKIRIDGKPRYISYRFGMTACAKLFTKIGCTATLPNDGVINGSARSFVPNDGGLALIGDADGGDFLGRDACCNDGFRHGRVLRSVDLKRIMLDVACRGIKLCKFLLRLGNDLSVLIKENGTGAGRALVQG